MHSLTIVTVITRNYLAYAQALALSIKEQQPRVHFAVCLADDPGADFQAPAEWDSWFVGRDLGIASWRRFAFQYTPFELSCALKPFAVQHLLRQGHSQIAYLDADMQVFRPLTELSRWLDDADVLLTPHERKACANGPHSHEKLYLMAGTFNAGFFAVKAGKGASEFLAWWEARVRKDCIHDLTGGIFVDQKWLDLAPNIFPGIRIVRHQGYNAGHWTLMSQPRVESLGGQVLIDGDPLAIYHFSRFCADKPELISHHPGCTVANFPAFGPLCAAYARRQKACGCDKVKGLTCEFDRLTDGTPIDPLWREAVRVEHGRLAGVSDPFDVSSTPRLVELFQRAEADVANNRQAWRLANLAKQRRQPVVTPSAVTAVSATAAPRPFLLKRWGKKVERNMRKIRDWVAGNQSADAHS